MTEQLSEIVAETTVCPACGSGFPTRGNKIYCSKKCSRNAARTTQNRTSSLSKAREEELYWSRVSMAYEMWRNTKPEDRFAWLQGYIDNPTTKKIVCNPALLNAKGSGYPHGTNIAKIAHNFTKSHYDLSIRDYYKKRPALVGPRMWLLSDGTSLKELPPKGRKRTTKKKRPHYYLSKYQSIRAALSLRVAPSS